jgi:radical SAM superfamily enzyme YgiQ (UPF0313 family)
VKILLMAVNAKYIHSNLAVYSLAAYARQKGFAPLLGEFTINQTEDQILRAIYREAPSILAVSVYIWNADLLSSLLWDIHRILPDTKIWLGGPEVSFDSCQVLERMPFVSGVMRGEGEATFAALCAAWDRMEEREEKDEEGFQTESSGMIRRDPMAEMAEMTELAEIAGITWRNSQGVIRQNPDREPLSMDELPFPYGNLEGMDHRIIYYESSRGCPFSCSYCLSSVDKKLRFRSLDKVFGELSFFLERRVPQVKFVDRTFNCRRDRTLAIWQFLLQHDNGVTNFHFEISADLLNEEEIGLLHQMRPGLVQLEIGVQSVNEKTLEEIGRGADFQKICRHVRALQEGHNLHQHLDLIAGLPWEDYDSFRNSFNQVYALAPQQLQLGFLKVLKGSPLCQRVKEYGCLYKKNAPYEVLATHWLPYGRVLDLKLVEEMVEVYYNSGQFTVTMRKMQKLFPDAFSLYEALGAFYQAHDYLAISHTRMRRYEILLEFLEEKGIEREIPQEREAGEEGGAGQERKAGEERESRESYISCMMWDLYARENLKSRPSWAPDQAPYKDWIRQFFQEEAQKHIYLENYQGYDWKQMRSMTHMEFFPEGLPECAEELTKIGQKEACVVLFDYSCRDPLDGSARRIILRL